jgi:hypothetical protein
MKRLHLIGGGLVVLLALASLAVFHGSFAAGPPANHTPSVHTTSVFAQEHQAGKPGSGMPQSSNLTCGKGANKGNLVVNSSEHIANDADSGQAGNYWAIDTIFRTIKVYNMGSDSWCAVLIYTGTFAAQAGQKSPGSNGQNGGILTGDEVGTLKGGYVAQITGPLDVSDSANWPLVGKVNKGKPVDYQCVINPDGSTNGCPGAVDWTTKYFDTSSPSFTFIEDPWGWTYVGHDGPGSPDPGTPDGTWNNYSTGDSGDILYVDN